MKKNTKLINMDLYGIISLGSYWDVTNWLAKKFRIDPEKIYAVLYHKYFSRAAMGEITERELFKGALSELHIDMQLTQCSLEKFPFCDFTHSRTAEVFVIQNRIYFFRIDTEFFRQPIRHIPVTP